MWPTDPVDTSALDEITDTPPRATFFAWAQKFNQLIAHVSGYMQGLLTSADAAAARTTLDVPSRSGGNANGTWNIGISGNAATATTASNLSRSVAGAGLASGGGALTTDRTITVTAASQAQAEAGTDNATAMTPLATAQAIAKRAPAGYGRVWTTVTGSRTRGTAIQNVSSRDLWLSINGDGGSLNVQVSPDGSTWTTVADWSSGSGGYERYTATVLVPPGHYYKVSSGGTLNSWKELL